MSFIDSYEEQLVAAARRQRDARVRNRIGRRLRGPHRRGLSVALAALLIGVPAAAATVGGWNPFDDPGRNPRFPAPAASQRALDPGLVATLGVLRRPQDAADRGVATSHAARSFSNPQYRGVRLDGIRVLDPQHDVVLVPFEQASVPTDRAGRPLPGFDQAAGRSVVCVYEASSDGFAGSGCHNAAKIRSGRAISSSGNRVSGLVPDGVARVRLIHGDGTVEADVHDNYFAADSAFPTVVEWLRDDGSVARRIDLTGPPPAG